MDVDFVINFNSMAFKNVHYCSYLENIQYLFNKQGFVFALYFNLLFEKVKKMFLKCN